MDDAVNGGGFDTTATPGSHHHPVLWGLLLSSLAGGSTTIGGLIGVLRRPNDSTLAFLLGVAIGVMMLLAVIEMWVHNALEHGSLVVTMGFVAGAGMYRLVQARSWLLSWVAFLHVVTRLCAPRLLDSSDCI